ncbi:ZapG family protein [Paraglaciecola psychrophila]|uniref:DUF1043 domain-containing protein n=1 Tax=Paraglaciecola psychrophila 170 TaxID=1129794 RepID=K7AAR6_9ALTE|nr:DUF1043 family protein [Paraglaciecola psychrophila]AGH47172.1 hypothetical protein C427_5073 [Paraglaciecola psychrophila 170]GAC39367.1 hypothetical protein GPSY_3756 [Paraglaciecola psychrophila 170]
MDLLVGLLLLAVGGIIGFFVAKYVNKDNQRSTDKAESEQTIQELMNQQAAEHIKETKQIAENLNAQSAILKQQIDAYEQLLISQKAGPERSSLSYFGEHTTAYLRNKSTKPTREKLNADIQPLDFSSQSSGLFSGTKEVPAKESK